MAQVAEPHVFARRLFREPCAAVKRKTKPGIDIKSHVGIAVAGWHRAPDAVHAGRRLDHADGFSLARQHRVVGGIEILDIGYLKEVGVDAVRNGVVQPEVRLQRLDDVPPASLDERSRHVAYGHEMRRHALFGEEPRQF